MRKIFSWIIKLSCAVFLWSIAYTIYLTVFNPLITTTQIKSILQGQGLQRKFVTMHEIANSAKLALVAAEDFEFLENQGFDWEGIADAFRHNQRSRRLHGASTIGQQLAKNIFLWQARSYLRKALEVYFTILIESFLTKKRIIALYLNTVEFGKGIYGIEAASQYYYKKSAKQLTNDEAIRLMLCLPSPKKRSPYNLGKVATNQYNIVAIDMNTLRRDDIVKKYLLE